MYVKKMQVMHGSNAFLALRKCIFNMHLALHKAAQTGQTFSIKPGSHRTIIM